MTVSTIATIAAGFTRTEGSQTAKSAAALRGIVAAAQTTSPAAPAVDVASFPTATVLKNQISSLRLASQNIAAAGTALDVAQGGSSQVSQVLGQLQDLAARASSPDLSPSERIALSNQFAALRGQITQITATTRFNNEPLLDGKSSQISLPGESADQQVGALTDQALFADAALAISTPDGAKAAAEQIAKAQAYVAVQSGKISNLQNAVNQVAVTVESALQNNAAANSTLNDSDLQDTLATPGSEREALLAKTSSNPSVQTGRLPPAILKLLAE